MDDKSKLLEACKFLMNEIVLCYEPDPIKARMLYDAKVSLIFHYFFLFLACSNVCMLCMCVVYVCMLCIVVCVLCMYVMHCIVYNVDVQCNAIMQCNAAWHKWDGEMLQCIAMEMSKCIPVEHITMRCIL